MPIEIPRVQRIDTAGPLETPKLDVKVPDFGQGMQKQAKSAENLIGAVGEYVNRVERDAADTEATKRDADLQMWFRTKMYGDGTNPGIKYQEGNPTDVYKSFDEEFQKKFNELTSSENLSGFTREQVTKRLTNTMNNLELQKVTEYGAQQAKYDNDIFASGVQLEKSNLPDASAYIDPTDPSTFAPFDQNIERIRSMHLRRGMKFGAVVPDDAGEAFYVDDDGKPIRVKASDNIHYEMSKDLSEGIYNSLDNAIKANRMDVARALREKYGNYLDPVKKRQITDDFVKADIQEQAYAAAFESKRVGVEKALSKLSPEARDKALGIIDDEQRRMDNIRERSSKRNYNALSNHVNEIMRSETPYSTVSELENDPQFKNIIGRVTDAKQKQAIYDMVVQPKMTSDASLMRVNDLFFGTDPDGRDILSMPAEDFYAELTGLNKVDRNRAIRRYESMKTETGREQATRYKSAGKELENQLESVKFIKRDNFNRFSGKDRQRLLEAQNELVDYLDKNSNGPMSPKEIKDYTRQFAISKKTGDAFQPPVIPRFNGTVVARGTAAPKKADPKISNKMIKGKTWIEWGKEFNKQFGRWPEVENGELQKFVKEQD